MCFFSSYSLWWPIPVIPSCMQEVFLWNWTPVLHSRDMACRTWLYSAGGSALADMLRSWIGHSPHVGSWATAIQVPWRKPCLWMRASWSQEVFSHQSPGKSWAGLGLCSLSHERGKTSGRCDETSTKNAEFTFYFECCQPVFSSSCSCQNWRARFYSSPPAPCHFVSFALVPLFIYLVS